LGFKEEGFAARYIQIDGLWRDHVLYGLPIEDWEKRGVIV
jgi:ribosomal-protein-alanine N-acetyltransferase